MINHEQLPVGRTLPLSAVTAWASVVMVMVLGIGAAGLSVVTSPTTPGAAALPRNDTAAVASLRQAAEVTMKVRDFTVAFTQNLRGPRTRGTETGKYRWIYQAPDRLEVTNITPGPPGQFMTITVGSTYYVKSPTLPGEVSTETWSEVPVKSRSQTAAVQATLGLSALLHPDSVERSGNTYRSETARTVDVPATPFSNGGPTPESAVITTVVAHGMVVYEDLVFNSLTERVQMLFRYSAFDASPPVELPPVREIVPGGCIATIPPSGLTCPTS